MSLWTCAARGSEWKGSISWVDAGSVDELRFPDWMGLIERQGL